jgi:hypothetical protein
MPLVPELYDHVGGSESTTVYVPGKRIIEGVTLQPEFGTPEPVYPVAAHVPSVFPRLSFSPIVPGNAPEP